jgi:molybdopterin-synthase adenylyltransferase
VDVWTGDFERIQTQRGQTRCPVCDDGRYELLNAEVGSLTSVLCGRNAVQIRPRPVQSLNLAALATRLEGVGRLAVNDYLLRLEVEGCQLTLFPDGRAIVKGTADPVQARALYARYVGV